MKEMLDFLKSQRLLVLASKADPVWVSNIYYGVDDGHKIYFVSNEETEHSKQILADPKVAFSVVWFNQNDYSDRKGVQGLGVCRLAKNDEEISKGVEIHNDRFPAFAKRIVVSWIKSKLNKSHVYVIEPSYIKYWDDKLYGKDGVKEFTF